MNENMTLHKFLSGVYVPSRLDLTVESADQIGYAIKVLDEWHGSPVKLSDLSEPFLRGFLHAYLAAHSASTVNSKRGHLLAVWQCAWEEGYLPHPPRRRKVPKAKTILAVPEAWSPAELGRILQSCAKCRGNVCSIPTAAWWRSILLVAYDTGERRRALLAVEPADVNLERGFIVFKATKTKRQRWCKVAPETVDAMRVIYVGERSRLWPWPYRIECLNRALCRILLRAGVRFGRPSGGVWHKFRRTSGSLVEQAGGDGSRHLGNTRAVFERHYRDPRMFSSTMDLLPRPEYGVAK